LLCKRRIRFDKLFHAAASAEPAFIRQRNYLWEDARRPHRIKFNLMVPVDCEPTSASCASAVSRLVDRVIDGVST
jgi:hypothetical protein